MTNKSRSLIDDSGWRVPRDGTLARPVYDLAKFGFRPRYIAWTLGMSENSVRVTLCHMKYWQRVNTYEQNRQAKVRSQTNLQKKRKRRRWKNK
jgi:hypothetical protein